MTKMVLKSTHSLYSEQKKEKNVMFDLKIVDF